VSVDCISFVQAEAAKNGDYLDVVFDILPSDPFLNRTCVTPNVTLEEIYDYLAGNSPFSSDHCDRLPVD
jgi:hypothetical protein